MEKIWLEVQSNIEKVLTPQTFNTWIRPIKFISASNDLLELAVPNKFIQEWVNDKYMGMIQEAVSSLTDAKYQIRLKISEPTEPGKAKENSDEPVMDNILTTKVKNVNNELVS